AAGPRPVEFAAPRQAADREDDEHGPRIAASAHFTRPAKSGWCTSLPISVCTAGPKAWAVSAPPPASVHSSTSRSWPSTTCARRRRAGLPERRDVGDRDTVARHRIAGTSGQEPDSQGSSSEEDRPASFFARNGHARQRLRDAQREASSLLISAWAITTSGDCW